MTLQFSVCDTGIGIPREDLPSIFDSFSHATRSTHAKYGGTGLGLSIAKHLVELMGGRIWVESEPGRGSAFFFAVEVQLPEETVAPRGDQIGEERPGPAAHPLRILLAEDNAINQMFAQALLEGQGHTVVVANNGQEALDVLAGAAFDVVLMDVQMPVLDGIEAAQRIRRGEVSGVARDIPIVALTAHALKGDRERFLDAGMDDYLAKPLELEEIARILHRVSSAAGD